MRVGALKSFKSGVLKYFGEGELLENKTPDVSNPEARHGEFRVLIVGELSSDENGFIITGIKDYATAKRAFNALTDFKLRLCEIGLTNEFVSAVFLEKYEDGKWVKVW